MVLAGPLLSSQEATNFLFFFFLNFELTRFCWQLYPIYYTCRALNSSSRTETAVAMRAHYKYLAVLQGFKYLTTAISYLHKMVVDCKCQAS